MTTSTQQRHGSYMANQGVCGCGAWSNSIQGHCESPEGGGDLSRIHENPGQSPVKTGSPLVDDGMDGVCVCVCVCGCPGKAVPHSPMGDGACRAHGWPWRSHSHNFCNRGLASAR